MINIIKTAVIYKLSVLALLKKSRRGGQEGLKAKIPIKSLNYDSFDIRAFGSIMGVDNFKGFKETSLMYVTIRRYLANSPAEITRLVNAGRVYFSI